LSDKLAFFVTACQFFFFGIIFVFYKLKNFKKHIMSNPTIKPLADRVLVEPLEAETKTASGIIIPDTAKEKPQKGIVVAVGPGTKDEPLTVKVGDTVLYGKYSGTELKLEGTEYLMMRESDILAII
jgi:chaperonin GroES